MKSWLIKLKIWYRQLRDIQVGGIIQRIPVLCNVSWRKLRSRRREWELWAVLSLMCRVLVSTNRSLGCQPAIISRRILLLGPWLLVKGPAGKILC